MQLEIDAVHQAERLELVFRDLAGKPPRDLSAELSDALVHELLIEFVVTIHDCAFTCFRRSRDYW